MPTQESPRLRLFRPILIGTFSLVVLGVRPDAALAHAVSAEFKIQDGNIIVDVFFDDNTPARGASVKVSTNDKKVIAGGTTNGIGQWSFPVPPPGKYEVAINAGAGHGTKIIITIRDSQTLAKEQSRSDAHFHGGPTEMAITTNAPQRTEFTRFPWQQTAIGLVLIALLSVAMMAAVRFHRPNSGTDSRNVPRKSNQGDQTT